MRPSTLSVVAAIASLALVSAVVISCSRNSSSPTAPVMSSSLSGPLATGSRPAGLTPPVTTSGTGASGVPNTFQAYYDSSLFTITLVPMPANAQTTILARNGQINQIYMSEPEDTGSVFVIDAIPTDGMNPMWREVEIHFNQGFTPHQFYSDDQVNNAASGSNPEITLAPTDEIYRCAIVGQKP